MTKATKRWAVRERDSAFPYYIVALSMKPYKRDGRWVFRGCDTRYHFFDPFKFEMVFPERYHLAPGGGPVEIRFTDEA